MRLRPALLLPLRLGFTLLFSFINEVVVRCVPGSRLVVIPKATHPMSYQNPAGSWLSGERNRRAGCRRRGPTRRKVKNTERTLGLTIPQLLRRAYGIGAQP